MLLKLQLSDAEIVQGGHDKGPSRLRGGRLEGRLRRPLIAHYSGGTSAICATSSYAMPVVIGRNETRQLSLPVKFDVRSGG
jgi:hypothetical protein